jgi:hypothetical protein
MTANRIKRKMSNSVNRMDVMCFLIGPWIPHIVEKTPINKSFFEITVLQPFLLHRFTATHFIYFILA